MGIDPVSTTFAITTGIISGIATDMLEHNADALEGTLAGKVLKRVGMIEPNFNDRLRDTLKKSLELYFETYPHYNLSGIDTFFRDPAVARQIGGYILNRRPIDEQQIQQALNQHILSDAVTAMLIKRRNLAPQQIIPDFLACYRQVLNRQLSVPQMSILLEVMDQTSTLMTEIQASEARMKDFIDKLLQTRLSPDALRAVYQAGQKELAADLTQQMDAAGLVQPDEAVQTIQQRLQSLPRLFAEGLCKGRILQSAVNQYFVSHGFQSDTLVDWRDTLAEALAHASKSQETLSPYFSGDTILGGFRLCGICEKLYATRFSLFLLPPSEDRNVYLELGIAIGLGAPFFLIQHREAKLPALLEGLSRYESKGTFRTMRKELAGKIEEYDFGAVRLTKDLPTAGSQPQYLLGAGNLVDDEDFEGCIADAIQAKYPDLATVSLARLSQTGSTSWPIEQLIDTIQATRFGVYRVNEQCSPTTFVALGISIGLNRPVLMIKDAHKEVPLDLRGIGLYAFPNFAALEREVIAQHQSFFAKHA